MASRAEFSKVVRRELQRPNTGLLFCGATAFGGLQLAILMDPAARCMSYEQVASGPESQHLVIAADTAADSECVIRHPAQRVATVPILSVLDAVPLTRIAEELHVGELGDRLITDQAERWRSHEASGLTTRVGFDQNYLGLIVVSMGNTAAGSLGTLNLPVTPFEV